MTHFGKTDRSIASDGVAGKPELCDYGWMGVRQRLMRAETLFRGSHKPQLGSFGSESCTRVSGNQVGVEPVSRNRKPCRVA